MHVGGDHGSDACVVYVPEERIMFLSDCLYPDIYSPIRRYTVARLFPLIDQLLSYDVDYYLEGHNPAPVPRAEMVAYTASLKLIGRIVEERGDDRAAILADVERTAGGPADEDTLESVDLFLAGLGGATNTR
jgi:glyoxylase-like metal-dependent hydrolase (beta-lactamase superfamily II)